MSGAWVLLTISSYAALLLLRRNAPLLHRLAIQSVAVLDGMLSDGDDDAKLAALEAATGRLLRALFSFLLLLWGVVPAGGRLKWVSTRGISLKLL